MEHLPDLIKINLVAAWRRRWVAIAVAWATSIAGWLYLAHIPNQYESSAKLYVDSDAILVPLLRGIAIDTSSVNQAELMRKTLLSPSNLDRLISLTPLRSLVKSEEDQERLNRALGENIKITSHERNLFGVAYRAADPALAYAVVRAALTIFLDNQAGSSKAEMQNAQRFLREQIGSYEKQLTEAENRRAEFRARYYDLLPNAANTGSRLQGARAALETDKLELSDAQTRLDALQRQIQGIPQLLAVDAGSALILPSGAIGGPTLSQQRLAEAERNLDALMLRFTDAHPDVIAARRLIATLRKEAAGSPDTAAAGTGGDQAPRKSSISNPVYEQVKLRLVDAAINVASIQQKIEVQTAEINRLEKLARDAPSVEAEYERLDRDYNVLKKNHDELLGRLEAAKIASAADSNSDSKVRVVEPPRLAQLPVAPKRSLLTIAILVAGIGAGCGCVFLLQKMDRSFSSVGALRQLGLPVLGAVSLGAKARGLRLPLETIGFAALTLMLFVVCGGLVLHASGMRLSI